LFTASQKKTRAIYQTLIITHFKCETFNKSLLLWLTFIVYYTPPCRTEKKE
jgi:hypothetical protein